MTRCLSHSGKPGRTLEPCLQPPMQLQGREELQVSAAFCRHRVSLPPSLQLAKSDSKCPGPVFLTLASFLVSGCLPIRQCISVLTRHSADSLCAPIPHVDQRWDCPSSANDRTASRRCPIPPTTNPTDGLTCTNPVHRFPVAHLSPSRAGNVMPLASVGRVHLRGSTDHEAAAHPVTRHAWNSKTRPGCPRAALT